MNKHQDKFRHFARGRHRKGKIMRLAMVFLPLLLLFSICSAFMGHGGRGHGRHGEHSRHDGFHQAQNGEFDRSSKGCRGNRCGMEENAPSVNANVPASTQQANAQNEDALLDELTIIQDALDRAVTGEDITVQQRNLIMAQETRRFTEKKEEEQKNEDAAPAPAPAASDNSSNQTTSQSQVRGESRRHHRHRGFSPIGFLIAGLFKLGLLFFLFSFIARRFGFRPWRRPLGFRRWQQAYADAWGTPVSDETPIAPEDEDEDDDDIARELEREEQKQQAQQAKQKKSKDNQAAKSEDVSDDSDENKSEDKNAA